MIPPKKTKRQRPEADIQKKIIAYLREREWLVRVIKADEDHSGWPDLFATHSKWGIRFIEVKLPDMKGSNFTSAQLEWFPKMAANGTGVWILTSATQEEYEKLFRACNLNKYLLLHSMRSLL